MDKTLAKVPLFRGLPKSDLKALADASELRRFRKRELIFKEGEPADSVWVVKGGWVYLVKQTRQGGLATIFAMTPDEAICGVSAFDHGSYSASAVAATDTQVIRIPAAVFSGLLDRDPKFSKRVLLTCCARIRHMADTIALSNAPAEQRLAYVLLRLRATFGKTVPVTHQVLAQMAGIRWETSVRTIAEMKKKGWITVRRAALTILKPDPLKQLLESPASKSR